MLEYIDDFDNAVLTDGNEIIATSRGPFGEVLFIDLHNNFILLENSKYRDKLIIIDTINKTKKEIKKPWQLEDGVEIEHKDLKSMINFYQELSNRWEYDAEFFIALLSSVWITILIMRGKRSNELV